LLVHAAPEEFGMRPAYRTRPHERIAKAEKLSLEAEGFSGPCALEDLDGLKRAAQALGARNLKTIELLGAVAQPDSEPQAAVRDHVDERGVLGQAQGMVKRGEQDVGADRHASGAGRDCGKR